jgi:hypothetical protein
VAAGRTCYTGFDASVPTAMLTGEGQSELDVGRRGSRYEHGVYVAEKNSRHIRWYFCFGSWTPLLERVRQVAYIAQVGIDCARSKYEGCSYGKNRPSLTRTTPRIRLPLCLRADVLDAEKIPDYATVEGGAPSRA